MARSFSFAIAISLTLFAAGCGKSAFVQATFDSPVITSIAVSCNPSSIQVGQSSQCGATVSGSGAYSQSVTWTATNGTISAGGAFTPAAAGSATITGTSAQDTTKFGTTAVSVGSASSGSSVSSVSVSCSPSAISNTQTSACTANVSGTGSYSTAVTWSATGGTITAGGVFTPTGAGTATVTAKSVQDATKLGTATVVVTAPGSTITSVSVNCSPASIQSPQTSTCTANVSGTGSYNSTVAWSATGGTITAGGVFMPSGAGTATVTAISVQDATKFGTATVVVTAPTSTITSVSVNCSPASIQPSQTSACTASVSGTGSYNSAVTWSATGGTITAGGAFTPSGGGTATITATSVQDTTKTGSATVTIQSTIRTVFIILMENQNWNTSVAGNFNSSNAPYIVNTIIPNGATANNYTMVNSGPSEPNYKWLEAGDDFGQTTDNDPSSSNSISTTQHLVTYLSNAGISWKAYIENIDGTKCPLASSFNSLSSTSTIGGGAANYYAKHNPFIFFNDLTDNLSSTSATCINHVRPYGELANDLSNGTLARYNFIVPNGTDDMHDSNIKTGDTWLSQNVPAILGSGAYQNNGVLFILWDESANESGTLPLFVLSPLIKSAGYSNSIQYNHNSTLLTLEKIFGVGPCLGYACGATDLSDLFVSGAF